MRSALLLPFRAIALLAVVDRHAGLGTWLELRGELRASRIRIDRLHREVEALRAEVRALERDPFSLERAIREDLDLAKPGEVIVRFGSKTARGLGSNSRFP